MQDSLLDLASLAVFWALHGLLSAFLLVAWLWHETAARWKLLVEGELVLGAVVGVTRQEAGEKQVPPLLLLQRTPRHCVLALPRAQRVSREEHLKSCASVVRHCVLLGVTRVTLFEESGSASAAVGVVGEMVVGALDAGWRCDRIPGTSLLELRSGSSDEAPTCTVNVLGDGDGEEAVAEAAREMAAEERGRRVSGGAAGAEGEAGVEAGGEAGLSGERGSAERGPSEDRAPRTTSIGDGSCLLERVAAYRHLGDADVLLYAENGAVEGTPLPWTRTPALLLRCPELVPLRCSAAVAAADARRVLAALRVFERTVQRNGK